MSRILALPLFSVVLLFITPAGGSGAGNPAKDESIANNIPAPSCTAGFVIEKKAVLYNRETLYERINGESELYLPYGFEVLASARYAKKNDAEAAIEVDIYRMGSLLNAFGIYANYRRKDDPSAGMGADSLVSPPLILFYQDRFFVRVQSAGEREVDKEHLISCARTVSGMLPAGKGTPAELAPFRVPGVVQKSERFIAKSLLGYEFFPSGIIADAFIEGEKFQVFLVSGESPDASGEFLNKYLAFLKDSGKRPRVHGKPGGMVLEAEDPLYGGVYIEQWGRHIVGAARLKNTVSAKMITTALRNGLTQ